MPTDRRSEEPPKRGIRQLPRKPASPAEQEVLREQSRTETEQRPYLDTEGGE
jgi:hypothetical protein